MIFLRLNKKGQSVLEVSILLGIVAMALMTIQLYAKRSLQAHLKHFVDHGGTQQYEPYYFSSSMGQSGYSSAARNGGHRSYYSRSHRNGTETVTGPSTH